MLHILNVEMINSDTLWLYLERISTFNFNKLVKYAKK